MVSGCQKLRRDIQINVVPCPINFPPDIVRPTVTGISGDTLTFIKGQETCFDFRVEDFNGEGIAEDNLKHPGNGRFV